MHIKFNVAIVVALTLGLNYANAYHIIAETDNSTGAVSKISIAEDSIGMNWILTTDGSQYPWVSDNYSWGLGYFTQSQNHVSNPYEWKKPLTADKNESLYREGNVEIKVKREQQDNGDLVETYTFKNVSNRALSLHDAGIYVPFNDNYPDSKTCISSRTNAHIWPGKNAAWVNALRMGATAPHLGLAVTEGEIAGYQVHERGSKKGNSQYRGVISLLLPELWLSPGQEYTLQWCIFGHDGTPDFKAKAIALGLPWLEADKYVFQVGEEAKVKISTNTAYENVSFKVNGKGIKCSKIDDGYEAVLPILAPGEILLEFEYDGKVTQAELLAISSEAELLLQRLAFILDNQQLQNPTDLRDGAYMIYDNEGDSIYLNDKPNCNPVDRDEGAERVGMGVLMAKMYRLTSDSVIGESVKKYAKFVRERLQTPDYVTYSSVDQTNRNRGYNYMWVADLYFQLYLATGDKQYAIDGYKTLDSMFKQFGHSFYAIGIPVKIGIESLEKAGMKKERKLLLQHFEKLADTMIKNGLEYPPFEVNYEQSIVAPAIQFLAQMFQVTGEQKYLDEVRHQLPVLEAFNGCQPSYHLNDIALRHWDGYWFGKREMFGDTMPHYWSTITAAVFHYYYQITGDKSYKAKAENIVRNNLCLFMEDGRASCAYLYPDKIDGAPAKFYDPYANDQDWALVYYLLVHNGI